MRKIAIGLAFIGVMSALVGGMLATPATADEHKDDKALTGTAIGAGAVVAGPVGGGAGAVIGGPSLHHKRHRIYYQDKDGKRHWRWSK